MTLRIDPPPRVSCETVITRVVRGLVIVQGLRVRKKAGYMKMRDNWKGNMLSCRCSTRIIVETVLQM